MNNSKRFMAIACLIALTALSMGLIPASANCTPSETGSAGQDQIECTGYTNSNVVGKGDDDTITNKSGGEIDGDIRGGAGNDTITNNGDVYYFVVGNAGDDYIINGGWIDGRILGGSGSDVIINNGIVVGDIRANEDNDTIINNYIAGWDIKGHTGNDVIINNGYVINDIDGGADEDLIVNNGFVFDDIQGESGDDTIFNNNFVADDIEGNGGNDTIINSGMVGEDVEGGIGDDQVILSGDFVVYGYVDGGPDYDILTINSRSGDRDEVAALKDKIANNAGQGTATWHGNTLSWINFEELNGDVRYRNYVAANEYIRVVETFDSLLLIGWDKAKKIEVANPIRFNRLKHITYGQVIGSFTDKEGYTLTLYSVSENIWSIYYFAPDGSLISWFNFEFEQVW